MFKLRPWLQLVRAPNLATAMADVFAGAALAGASIGSAGTWIAALGSAALYAGGVALNDVFDVEKDRRLHPERMLPSGRLQIGTARAVGFLALASGAALGAAQGQLGVGLAMLLAGCIVVYDALPDSASLLSVLFMGACRGVNLARGLITQGDALPSDWPVFVLVHIALVGTITWISLGEDRPAPGRQQMASRVALSAIIILAPALAAWNRSHEMMTALVLALGAALAWWIVRPARAGPDRSAGARRVVPRAVFGLTLFDALYCIAAANWALALLLAGLFVLSRLAARWLAQRGS